MKPFKLIGDDRWPVDKEQLYLSYCDNCKKRCSINGFIGKEGAIIHCPYCGHINEIEEQTHNACKEKT